jgi:hypothetical protein
MRKLLSILAIGLATLVGTIASADTVPTGARHHEGGEIRAGSNGSDETVPEIFLWDYQYSLYDWSRMTWDENVLDSFDSDWVDVVYEQRDDGYYYFKIGDRPAMTGWNDGIDSVEGVMFKAHVDGANRQLSTRDMVLHFFNLGLSTYEDVYVQHSREPLASTLGSTDPDDFADSNVWVGSLEKEWPCVLITFQIRLESLSAGLPTPDSLNLQFDLYSVP